MLLRLVEATAHTTAIASAFACARPGAPRYVPAARFLGWFLAATLAVDGARSLLDPPGAPPHHGVARAIFHSDQLLFLAGTFSTAALVAIVFLRWHPRHVLAALGCTACAAGAVLALSYPELRQESLGHVYTGVHLASTIGALGAVVVGSWDVHVDRPRRAVIWLVLADACILAAPYAGDPFGSWWTAYPVQAAAYMLLAWELVRR